MNLHEAAARLSGKVVGGKVRCPTPGKGRTNRSMSVTFNSDGTFVVTAFNGADWRDCRDHVKSCLGLSDERPVAFNDNTPSVDISGLVDIQSRIDSAARIWAECQPIAGTLAETYLRNRKLLPDAAQWGMFDDEVLAFHPRLKNGDTYQPAMVAMMTDIVTGEPCGVHRTFLDADGNRTAKKMLGRAKGACVRISPDEDVTTCLGIAEGVESAMAAMVLGYRPLWAVLSAGTMASFPILSGIETLMIFADNDESGTGQRAAEQCSERWHHATVIISTPENTGEDMADLLKDAA